MMKEVLKLKGEGSVANESSKEGYSAVPQHSQVLSRTIPAAVLSHYTERVRSLQGDLEQHFKNERMKASIASLEEEAERAQNLLDHDEEINARPARTWYTSEKHKSEVRDLSRVKVQEEQQVASLGKEGAQVLKSASERAAALARLDDYPLERSNAEKDKSHKMSRKKRRRLEALRDDEADNNEESAGSESKKKGASGKSGLIYFKVVYV
jgi:hypothetical protein